MKDFEFNEIYIEGEGDNIRLYIKPLYKEKIYLDANLDDYELSEDNQMLFDKSNEDYPGKFQNCAYVVNDSGELIELKVEEENTAQEDGWGFYAGNNGSIVSEDDSPNKAGFYYTVDSWDELVKQYGDEDVLDLYTYDVVFNDDTDSNSKGFKESKQYCMDYIEEHNGTDWSYFEDYKGGTVSVVCNETGETVYEEIVK